VEKEQRLGGGVSACHQPFQLGAAMVPHDMRGTTNRSASVTNSSGSRLIMGGKK
jgi:hypothetical protein